MPFRFNFADYCTAGAPLIASFFARLTLDDANKAAQLLGTLVGIAFLIWRWRRMAKKPAPMADFEL